jgi:hypothetical protein
MQSRPRLFCAALVAASLGAGGLALAQSTGTETPRYAPWDSGQNLQSLLDELDALIDEAEKARAANPVFLKDLRDLAAKYEAAAAAPATPPAAAVVRLLSDNFTDGNYTAGPAWKVSAGEYRVETSGTYVGLRSTIAAQPATAASGNLAAAIIGAILQPQTGTGSTAKYASIYTPVKISNAFALKMELASKFSGGRFDVGPYQGASGNYGYRLAYFPGAAQGLQLLKVTPQGSTVIATYKGAVYLEDKKRHVIDWKRDSAGAMTVAIDGKTLITATDASLKDPFTGLLIINSGGDYAIRSIAIDGTQ